MLELFMPIKNLEVLRKRSRLGQIVNVIKPIYERLSVKMSFRDQRLLMDQV